MTTPLVSILIISYNQENYIEEAILSAVMQNYRNIEIVVSDDASQDNTASIILNYEKKYPGKIVPVLNEKNGGITKNSNRGLKVCRGEFVALMGGDDIFLQDKITKQVQWFLEDSNRVLCGHKVETFYMDGTKSHLHKKYLSEGQGPSRLLKNGSPFGATSVMLRRSALPKHGFHTELKNVSDLHLYIETLINGGNYGFIDGVFARYRRHDSNITNQRDKMTEEVKLSINIIKTTYPFLAKECDYAIWSLYNYGLGVNFMLANNNKAAAKIFLANIANIPLHLKSWLRLLQATKNVVFGT